MANVNPLSLGGSKQGEAFAGTFGTDNELWLKVFGGEVLTAFEKAIEVSPRVMSRTISSGRSAQFPVHGRVNSRMHKPGEDILDSGNTARAYQDASATGGVGRPQDWTANTAATYLSHPGATEKIININDLMIASVFIDDLDEAKAHYDLRSAYTTELGRAMARKLDNLTVRALAAGAADTAGDEVLRGGQTITDGNMLTQADTMASSIIGAAQKLDEYDVPTEERFCVLTPQGYYLLLRAAGGVGGDNYAALLSKDYSMGNGDYAEGRVLMVAGIPIVVSNNTGFGTDFTTTDFGEQNSLGVNLTNHVGLVGHKNAAGILKLRDLQLESEYLTTHQGHLFVSKMACGVAPLHTDSVVALTTA